MFPDLYKLSWYKLSLKLRNIRNTYAKEHPLSIFEAVFKSAASRAGSGEKANFVFHHLGERLEQRIHKGRVYPLEVVFPSATKEDVVAFVENLTTHLYNFSNNFSPVEISQPVKRDLLTLEQEYGSMDPECQEICLEFHTPFPFTPKVRNRRWLLDKKQFVRIIHQRVKSLFGLDTDEMEQCWDKVTLLPYYWNYVQFGHRPKSNRGEEEYINGAVGPLYLKGPIAVIYPVLLLVSEFHACRKQAKGRGYFTFARDRAFFDLRLSDMARYEATWEEMEKESDMAEELAATFLDRNEALGTILRDVTALQYRPMSFQGFSVEKRRGGERIIASCPPRDHLVHKLLFDILNPVMDKMLENTVVGFRRGRSRETARAMIAEAYRDGFVYVLESDIASFFDQIDWAILMKKLRGCLPSKDRITLATLERCIKAPLDIRGKEQVRDRGLIQGSPLSPMLSNLYLDSFDEEMEKRGFRMIRYGDDFLVMSRTEEEAQGALSAIQEILRPLKLSLKEEKTTIKPVDMGFSFLGLDFGQNLDEDFLERIALRKTLFIQNQYAFVGVDGDSVVIRKDGELRSRLPIKRIGEIVIFGNNTVSARFLHKCSMEKIPVSFCAPSGYYMNTLRPDSKMYFSVAAKHCTRFEALGEDEKAAVSKRIVTSKIGNYLTWLGSRYGDASGNLRHQLETIMASLAKAESIPRIMGYEGEGASLLFRFTNAKISDPDFYSPRRLPHRKGDLYNSLLDFAYFLLFTRINVLLRSRGLNPYLGFLHSHKDHYESLVSDLQEPFRCRMDRMVVKLINLKVIKKTDFTKDSGGGCRLVHDAVGRFLEAFERECAVRMRGDGGTLIQLLVAQVQVLLNWAEGKGDLFFYQSGKKGISGFMG